MNLPRVLPGTFSSAARRLTRKIANALGVDEAQAEALKRQPGEKSAQIIEACDMPINNLITEIRMSMDYYMTEKNTQVDELFLSGGGSLLKGIEGVFEKNLGLPVKIWNPLTKVRLGTSAGIRGHSSFCLAVRRGFGFGDVDMLIDINLIPGASGKTVKTAASVSINIPKEMLLGVGVGLVLLLVTVHLFLGAVWLISYGQFSAHQAKWQTLLPDKKILDSINNESKDLKKKIGILSDMTTKKSVLWAPKFNAISDNLPRGLWIRRMTLDKAGLMVEGSVVSKTQNEINNVGLFLSSLKQNDNFMKDFSSLEVNSIQRGKTNAIEVTDFTDDGQTN